MRTPVLLDAHSHAEQGLIHNGAKHFVPSIASKMILSSEGILLQHSPGQLLSMHHRHQVLERSHLRHCIALGHPQMKETTFNFDDDEYQLQRAILMTSIHLN